MGQLEDMSLFVRVVEANGIGKAADQLGVAKSGVSRRLLALENRLGVRLINRTTRSMSLTEAGRGYYERAVQLITDVAELNTSTAEEERSLTGTLRVAAPLSFGLAHLSPALNAFACEHTGLNMHIEFSDHHVDLVERGLDLAIRIADMGDSSLRARRLCPIRIVLCASPAYLEQFGEPHTPDDLRHHQVLGYDIGAGTALRLTDGEGRQQVVNTRPRVVANNGDFLRDMAIAGHGIFLMPTFIGWKALATGELVTLLHGWSPPQRNAWAVYPQTNYLSRRARVFIDFLADRFGAQPYWDAQHDG